MSESLTLTVGITDSTMPDVQAEMSDNPTEGSWTRLVWRR